MSPLGGFPRSQGSGAVPLHEGHRCPRHELRTLSPYRALDDSLLNRYPNEPFYCKQDNKTAYQLAKDKHKHLCVQFLKSWYDTSQVRYQNSMASLGCDASLTATYCRIEICPCR